MIRNQLKNLLKLACLLFGMFCLVINCRQDDLITYEAHKEINAKTVSFEQAKAFFKNAQNKSQNAKSESDKSSSKELVLDPDWNSLEHSDLVYTEAKLTKANTEVNRDGAFTSKLLFVNIDDEIKSIVLTTWVTEYDLEDNIVNATIYFNDYEGSFIDAYKIENGLFTERLKPKPNIQTASFSTFFQGKEDDDCWNTDNLPEDGQLEAVNLGVIPSGSGGGGGYSGIGTGLPPGVTSAGGYGGYINSGVNSGGGLVTGSGGTSITTGGIDIGATTIIMNPPIQPDDEGKCPPGYTKDLKTGECIALCSGGKVYDATTKACKCPDGKVEDDDGNCVDCDDCSSCKKRTGYLHNSNFKNKTVTVGDNTTIKRDNFRNDSWEIIEETNCDSGKVPTGSTVKVTDSIAVTRPSTSLKYFKVEYDECSTDNKNKMDCSDDGCDTTKEDLKKVFPTTSDDRLNKIKDAINKYAKDFGIDTKEELQHFLAQAGHESKKPRGNEFEAFEEDLSFKWKELGEKKKRYWNPISDPKKDPKKANPFDYRRADTTSIWVDAEKYANWFYNDANRSKEYRLGNTSVGDGYKYRGRGIFQLTGKTNYSTFNTFYQGKYGNAKDLVTNPELVASDMEIAVISALWFFKEKVLDKNNIDKNTTVKQVTKSVNGGENGLSHREEIHKKAKENIDCNE